MRDRWTRSTGRTAPRAVALGAGGLLLVALLPATAAQAGSGHGCANRNNNSYDKLLECVTLEGVRAHQEALQKIADNSDDPVYPGTRAAGTDGYTKSAESVAGTLRGAGYQVALDPVALKFLFPAELRQLQPQQAEFETGS